MPEGQNSIKYANCYIMQFISMKLLQFVQYVKKFYYEGGKNFYTSTFNN